MVTLRKSYVSLEKPIMKRFLGIHFTIVILCHESITRAGTKVVRRGEIRSNGFGDGRIGSGFGFLGGVLLANEGLHCRAVASDCRDDSVGLLLLRLPFLSCMVGRGSMSPRPREEGAPKGATLGMERFVCHIVLIANLL